MLDLGKVEAGRLREAIDELLAKIANGAIPRDGATSMEVARLIDSAEKRIAAIEKDGITQEKEREENVRNLAIAYKAEQEAALNAEEKRQYESFLKKEYFTKDDFASLEQFYTGSYDKLTDGGKAEMSARVWEGVRMKEYEFIQLPDIVKEKEAASLRDAISEKQLDTNLQKIPVQDRDDFVREWDAGNKQASYQVLNRDTFADNVSLSAKSVAARNVAVTEKTLSEQIAKFERSNFQVTGDGKDSLGDLDLSLNDVQLISDEGSQPTVPLGGTKGSTHVKGG